MIRGHGFKLEPLQHVQHVEQKALDCLNVCREQLKLETLPLPIPVDEWIEFPLGNTFGITDLSHLGENVLGATYIQDKTILVSDQLDSQSGRFRFTCAHELGHMQLHADVQPVFRETPAQGPGSPKRIERQADRFAAAFLMPLRHLVPEIVRVLEQHRFDIDRCLPELVLESPASLWLWKRRLLPKLTRRFDVSLIALLNRFAEVRTENGAPVLSQAMKRQLLTSASNGAENTMTIEIVNGFPEILHQP